MNHIKTYITALLFSFCTFAGFCAKTPQSVMDKVLKNIETARGVSAKVSISGHGTTITADLKMKRNKFAFISSKTATWYNGRDMWVYNADSKETTLFNPSAEELSESNPLEYIRSSRSKYVPSFSNRKEVGMYVIILNPKKEFKNNPKVTLYITKNNFKPNQFTIQQRGASPVNVKLLTLDYRAIFRDSEFVYPKAKYPKAEVIDLR